MKRLALLLLLLLLAGCRPGPGAGSPASVYRPVDPALLQYENEDLLAAERVAHITMRQGQKLPSYARPLWGDWEEDRPKIAHILRLIRLAQIAERPEGSREGLADEWETLMTVEYADGRLVQVALAFRRLATGGHQSIQGRMYIPGMGEVIAPELDEFFRGAAKVGRVGLLVPVSVLEVEPRQASPGSRVTVRGEGWVGVEQIAILLLDGGTGKRYPLGEVPVGRGAFTWQGALPAGIKPGPRWQHGIALEVDGVQVSRTNIEIVN